MKAGSAGGMLRQLDVQPILFDCPLQLVFRAQQPHGTHVGRQVRISAIKSVQAQFSSLRPTQRDRVQRAIVRGIADIGRGELLAVGIQRGTGDFGWSFAVDQPRP